MKEDKLLMDLKHKLKDHSSEVPEGLWTKIESSIAPTKTTYGSSALTKSLIVAGCAVLITAGYYTFKSSDSVELQVNTAEEIKPVDISPETNKEEETFLVSEIEQIPEETKPVVKESKPTVKAKPLAIKEVTESIAESPKEEDKPANDFKIGKYISVFPASITPNGDGINDLFFIRSKNLENYSVVIINHQNTVVWKSNDPEAKWDARDLYGNKVFKGDYTVFLSAETNRGKKINEYRKLTIKY